MAHDPRLIKREDTKLAETGAEVIHLKCPGLNVPAATCSA
jgi:hypothetical protein